MTPLHHLFGNNLVYLISSQLSLKFIDTEQFQRCIYLSNSFTFIQKYLLVLPIDFFFCSHCINDEDCGIWSSLVSIYFPKNINYFHISLSCKISSNNFHSSSFYRSDISGVSWSGTHSVWAFFRGLLACQRVGTVS